MIKIETHCNRAKVKQIGYGNYKITHLCCNETTAKVTRNPYFRFDTSFSIVLLCSLLLSYYSIVSNLKTEDAYEVKLLM